MKSPLVSVLALLSLIVLLPRPAAAQYYPRTVVRGGLEFRGGAIHQNDTTLNGEDNTLGAIGLGLSLQFGHRYTFHRWRVEVMFDVVPLGGETFFDPVLGTDARLEDDLVLVNTRFGYDILQKPRFDVTLYYGGAASGVTQTFLLPNNDGRFVDVCDLQAFSDRCSDHWNFLGNAGTVLRFYPHANGQLYLGADYTRFATGKNLIMGTLGWRF